MQQIVDELDDDWKFLLTTFYTHNAITQRLVEAQEKDSVIPKTRILSRWLRIPPTAVKMVYIVPDPIGQTYEKVAIEMSMTLFGDKTTLTSSKDMDNMGILILPLSFLWDMDVPDAQNGYFKFSFEPLLIAIIQKLFNNRCKTVFFLPSSIPKSFFNSFYVDWVEINRYITSEITKDEVPLVPSRGYFVVQGTKVNPAQLTEYIHYIQKKLL